MSISRRITIGTLIGVLAAAPLAVLGFTQHQVRQTSLQDTNEIWVQAIQASDSRTQTATLTLEWAEPATVLAPVGLTGTVTALAGTGESISTGSTILTIDGVDVLAAHLDTPFYRPLTVRDTGPDVQQLNTLLDQLGHNSSSGNTFTQETLQGVRALAADMGVHNAAEQSVFKPQWIAHLPHEDGIIRSWQAQISGQTPPQGAVLLDLEPAVERAQLTDSVGAPLRSLPAGTVLHIGDQSIPIDTGHISGADLHDFGFTSDELEITAQLISPLPAEGWVLPGAAVWVMPQGEACVQTDTTGGIPVSILDSDLTTVTVTAPEMTTATRVLLSPPAGERECS